MASLSTKQEAEQKVAEIQRAIALMTHKKHRICLLCFAIYTESKVCYCDYESDRF